MRRRALPGRAARECEFLKMFLGSCLKRITAQVWDSTNPGREDGCMIDTASSGAPNDAAASDRPDPEKIRSRSMPTSGP
jgi:hypothetical protein